MLLWHIFFSEKLQQKLKKFHFFLTIQLSSSVHWLWSQLLRWWRVVDYLPLRGKVVKIKTKSLRLFYCSFRFNTCYPMTGASAGDSFNSKKLSRAPGIEPGSPEWQSGMLPLYHARMYNQNQFHRLHLLWLRKTTQTTTTNSQHCDS